MLVSMNLRYIAVGACGASAFIDMYATQPILPQLRTTFGADEASVGATVTAVTLACALAAPFIGPLADRFGRKRVIVTAIVLLALATFATATATTLGQLLAWRFLQGLFMPGIFAVTVAYIGEEFKFAVAGRAIGAYMTGSVVGGFLGRYLGAVISAHTRWETVFIVLGVLNLLGAAFVLAALPSARNFVRSPSLGASLRAIGGFVRSPLLLAIYAVGGSVLFTNVAVFTFVTFHLAEPPFSLPTVALGNVFVVYLLGIISAPVGGRLIDRLGNRTTALLALGISSAGLLVTLIPSVVAIVAGLAILSSSVFVTQMCSQGLIGRVVSENRSTAVALYFTVYYGLGGLGAVIPAWAWVHGGWPATVAVILAVQMLAAAIIALGWQRSTASERRIKAEWY